jgi:hypothetical protein
LPGQRKRVPYEYPQGRRVNVLAAYEPYAPEPWLGAQAFERTLTSDDLLAYLQGLPAASRTRRWISSRTDLFRTCEGMVASGSVKVRSDAREDGLGVAGGRK